MTRSKLIFFPLLAASLCGQAPLKFEVATIKPAALPDIVQPSLSTAIREQWGLKLEPAQGPFKVFVVESVQRPAEN